eukprot:3941596-Rhodomonas_salina.4
MAALQYWTDAVVPFQQYRTGGNALVLSCHRRYSPLLCHVTCLPSPLPPNQTRFSTICTMFEAYCI